MRWALSRTAIPCFGGTIPKKPNRGSVEGTLLHELLHCFVKHKRGANTEAFRPRRTLLGLVEAWAKIHSNNPRIDSVTMAAKLRIEDMLEDFRVASSHVRQPKHRANVRPTAVGERSSIFDGTESWLRDPESRLCGRADQIAAGEIVDFKSGERSDDDVAQVVFYAALYLAVTRHAPKRLRLVYTATEEIIDVPIPSLSELESKLGEMRHRAAAAEQQVFAGELPAKPEPSKCMFCHVRGLCDIYWSTLVGGAQPWNVPQMSVTDYAPTTAATIEPAAFGVYVRDKVAGLVSVLHVPKELFDTAGQRIERIRVISLRTSVKAETLQFVFTPASEVYVNQIET